MSQPVTNTYPRKTTRTPLALLLTLASVTAFAQTDYGKTINQLGVQAGGTSGSTAYFSAVEGLSLYCQFGVVYVDLSTDWGKGALAQLIAAKNTGRTLSRIDYVQPGGSGTVCNLTLVEVQN